MNDATEHQIQSAFIEWCHLNEKRLPKLRLGFAVPNGGVRHPATAAILKDEGVRRGVPDWICPAFNDHFRGIAIEFKNAKGKVTPQQSEYIALLREERWFVEVCYSPEDAIKVVGRYFESR